jgi:hypothetical protein
LGADFVAPYKEVHVRCFPRHIPQFIEVNITSLENPGDTITFANLVVNREEIEILDPEKEIVCRAETKKADHTIETVAPVATEASASAEPAKKEDDKAKAKKD